MPDEVRQQVEECRKKDPKRFTYTAISRWLRDEVERDLHPDVLRRHFNRHVEA